jgi:uncharacterized protein
MWRKFASLVLRNRIAWIVAVAIFTVILGYFGSQIQLSYEFAKILPEGDPALAEYDSFKKKFGQDGSIMVIGFDAPAKMPVPLFNDWYNLGVDLKKLTGVEDVISIANVYTIAVNDSNKTMDFEPVVKQAVRTESEMDSLNQIIYNLPFYDGLLYNKETGATLMAITFKQQDLNSKHRIELVTEIKAKADKFSAKNNITMHLSGMPYIRTSVMQKVSHEMTLFLVLAIVVMSLILLVFFRSFSVVFYSILVVTIGVVWSVGIIVLFGYNITILSGLIPPLIMVIGIPNCVFLVNKYHSEYAKHENKMKALSRMIETMGVSLFLANITTSIGFGVLYFTNSSLLTEFGVVAAVSVMLTYLITLILIPIILSYLKAPGFRQIKHLEAKRINYVLNLVNYLVTEKRRIIYFGTALITLISVYGMMKVNIIGFVVDDLPEGDVVYRDLRYFETNFKGILPFEIMVDTKQPNGVFSNSAAALYKINKLQKITAEYGVFSKPLSVVEGIKFSHQQLNGGEPRKYIVPGAMGLQEVGSFKINQSEGLVRSNAFVDSTKQYARISMQIADIGSQKTDELIAALKLRTDSVFSPDEYNVSFTGHSLMFLRGNDYLLRNLLESLLIEILLITLVGLALFRSLRIILLSKLPCLIPLIITAGIMGFLDIRFKPSTILIFSIAFGISSDGTIYFLTRYRHELKAGKSVIDAISTTIKETGIGMIYTAIILFSGFAIFAVSDFGGTVAMGILLSTTLLVAMVTNLLLLPAILVSINNRSLRKELEQQSLVDIDTEDEV